MVVKLNCICAFCLLLCCTSAQTQNFGLSFHHKDQEDGLGLSDNYFFFQDRQGFLWISTQEGLNRFDGKQFVKFTHSAGDACSIAENRLTSPCFEDQYGDLWLTSSSKVLCYQRKTGCFAAWSLPNAPLLPYSAFFLAKNGLLWLSIGNESQKQLYHFDTRAKTFLPQPTLIEGDRATLIFDTNGQPTHIAETQLPTRAGMVLRNLNDGTSIYHDFLTLKNGKKRVFPSPTNAAWADGDSVVWTGIYNGIGVFYPKLGKGWAITDRLPNVRTDLGWIYGIVPLTDTTLLLSGTYGLFVFDKKRQLLTQQTHINWGDTDGLKTAAPYQELYRAPDGSVWVSREKQGISFGHLQKRKFDAVAAVEHNIINTVFEDRVGRIWCSSLDSGTTVLHPDGTRIQKLLTYKNLLYPDEQHAMPPIQQFFNDSIGRLWGRIDNTLLLYNEKKAQFEFERSYLLSISSTQADRINACIQVQNSRILVAIGKTISYLSLRDDQIQLLPWHQTEAYPIQTIQALFQDKNGYFYIADQAENLFILQETPQGIRQCAHFKNIGICNSFIDRDKKMVLAATTKGLLRIEPESWQFHWFNEAEDGLPNHSFFNALFDAKGHIWLSGTQGLMHYNPDLKQVHSFSKADGLSATTSKNNVFLSNSKGLFWLGSSNGLHVFQPEKIALLNTLPNIRVVQLLVNDKLFTTTEIPNDAHFSFSYQNNTLSFSVSVLDYSDPAGNAFYYRLKGFEDAWVFSPNANMVRYPNLPPGQYVFEVKATNSDGIVNETATLLNIEIQPPFYKTWWFYLLCALCAIGIGYAWFWYRLQQAIKIERIRVQISSDLHDDVGTLLAGLAMQSEALELSAPEKDKGKLRRISEISRNAMAHMRDTVWAIDARKDKLENLLDRMREHAEETLTPKDILFDLTVENLSQKQLLPTVVRQHLYLIYKEAVTNAAKHSNGTMVQVHLQKSAAGFEMRICDNGNTPEKQYTTTGLGTSNMHMRAQKLGGTIEITRKNGFCVVLKMASMG